MKHSIRLTSLIGRLHLLWVLVVWTAVSSFAQSPETVTQLPDSIEVNASALPTGEEGFVTAEDFVVQGDSLLFTSGQEFPVESSSEEPKFTFTPDPNRAVWLSALCPGLGQLYNRRYWKLPIVVGAYMGLGYAMSWNNTMMRDYTNAYADIMDNDPDTNSYMDFFAPTVNESDLDKTWLTNILRTRKNFYRHNRDLCIICMIGVYLVAMVDAYVDASLAHFDISPDLSIDWAPTLINNDTRSAKSRPGFGVYWALNF